MESLVMPRASSANSVESRANSNNAKVKVTDDWKWARVDLSDNSTTVYSGACRIGRIYVDTALSAHACPIKDNTSDFASLIASLAAGSVIDVFAGSRFETSLVVDPDNAATGIILVQYREAEF